MSASPPCIGINEEDLFAAAIALPPSERGQYLNRACSHNADQLSRLTLLVEAFGDATTFVQDRQATGKFGSGCLGPYRLLRELGEGGCGVAYLAEQTTPVKREVAVKVIKPGMDTRAVIARFEAERQVLALLDHPNVAKVFDAGATPEGRPYFVMELVRGLKITEFCNHSRMTVRERLDLFTQVCRAIQHAHQKGIIHRDIKPSNVMVTMHDGQASAKVIDFGIAKAIHGRLIDGTLHTEMDHLVGTPAYVSPEQAESPLTAVDTRSDIYSLGVLLYELLTGQTPFDANELAQIGIAQLRERIRTEEPPRPSSRLNSLDHELLTGISALRGTTSTRLVKQIREDLDWIVMQCLEKEPSRRYQGLNELIEDVDRYLRHKAVLARPPSFTYTIRKVARRNRVAFAFAVVAIVFALFVTAFAIAVTIQAQRIAKERDQAEQQRQQAQKVSNVVLNVFAVADPFQSFRSEVSGAMLLEQAATSIEHELADQPAARARLLYAIGRAYIRRGVFKQAIGYLRESARLLSDIPGAENEALQGMTYLSAALRESGNLPQARQALVDAERFAEQFGLRDSIEYARLLLNRGRFHLRASHIQEAQDDFERSLRMYIELVGHRHVEVAETLGDLSLALLWTDDFVRAERIAREAIGIFDATVPQTHPDRVMVEANLAEALYWQNRLDEAAALLEGAIRKNTEVLGWTSPGVTDALDRLAFIRYTQRNYNEAERLSREALAAGRVVFGDKHATMANMATTLARILIARKKYSEAEATLREALEIFVATLPANHQYIASTEYLLGELLLTTNRVNEAVTILTTSMNHWKTSDAPAWRAMRSASALGEALYRQGHIEEGTRHLSESYLALSTDLKTDADAKNKARERVERYLRKAE